MRKVGAQWTELIRLVVEDSNPGWAGHKLLSSFPLPQSFMLLTEKVGGGSGIRKVVSKHIVNEGT